MNEAYTFYPPRRNGTIFQISAVVILILISAWGLWRAAHSSVGSIFWVYLLPMAVSIFGVPWLIYRTNILQSASYILGRENIQLRWGLRTEVIPMNSVLWVNPATDMETPLRYPLLSWPGAVLGTRRFLSGTPVEFLASQRKNLLLIACPARVFAVSPRDTNGFLQAYQRLTELGALSESEPYSVYPTFLLARIWSAPWARTLWLLGLILALGLLGWVGVTAATLAQVSLGFLPTGEPRQPIPGIRLMLLPVLNAIAFVVNTFLGILFYRQEDNIVLAYLLWSTSIFVALLFGIAVFLILRIP